MEGYKAFGKGMICRGKQYAENTVFEEGSAEICKSGMHFCKDPLDVLDYYPLVDAGGNITEFAEVEALDDVKTDDGKKYCTTKLKIGAKLSFPELVQASVGGKIERLTKCKTKKNGKNNENIISRADWAKIGSSGTLAIMSASGNFAQISSIGNLAQICSSGSYSRIGSSGYHAQIGSSGGEARIGSSGDEAQISSSGNLTQIVASGFATQIGSSGDGALIGASGKFAKIGSSGSKAQISASGDEAQIASSGITAQISSSGCLAMIASSGYRAQIKSTGRNSVICCAGPDCCASGKIGSWITLAEWGYSDKGEYKPMCVKTEYVDGAKIKEDTMYKLRNGEFVEAQE